MSVDPWGRSAISRREAIRSSVVGAGTVAAATLAQPAEAASRPDDRRGSPQRYDRKTPINLRPFPYPDQMSLRECLQLAKAARFDRIELNYDLENDLSPLQTSDHFRKIRDEAAGIGIAISGLCSFLFWPYSLTDNDPTRRSPASFPNSGRDDGFPCCVPAEACLIGPQFDFRLRLRLRFPPKPDR